MALVLIVGFALIASGVGQVILERLEKPDLLPLERFVFSSAFGLGIAAYGIYALGMCGLLWFWPVTVWWTLLALIGARGIKSQCTDLRRWRHELRGHKGPSLAFKRISGIKFGCVAALIVLGIISCIAAFRPPGAVEWDVLAYHLADPKVFLQQHRITILPTEHHSNFPFTVEMLFATGLLYQGFALANLFHLLLAALTVLGILAFGERFYGRGAGFVAAVLFATSPLVLWEASVAYIDVGAALYTTLAALATVGAIDARRGAGGTSLQPKTAPANGKIALTEANLDSWVKLAGIAMGFALGIKYLALIPLILCAMLMRMRGFNMRLIVRYLLIALVIGSPWYLKSAVLMRNPVYPFYVRVFPQTKYWSLGREQAYQSEQGGFGYPHTLRQPREAILNLLEAPWRLLADGGHYFNQGEYTFSALFGGMFGGLCLAGLLMRRHRPFYIDLGILAALQFVAWFFLAQVGRYLIQVLPLFALLGGITATRLIYGQGRPHTVLSRVLAVTVAALLIGNVAVVLWSVTMLPEGGKEANPLLSLTGMTAESAKTSQVLPTALSIPDALNQALHPEAQEPWLSRRLDVYDAEKYINHHAKPDDGVVLYEETRGLYLDRPYLWGNDLHSSYIPYDTFRDGADVTSWMNTHGIRYAIINLNWSPQNAQHRPIPSEDAEALIRKWYIDAPAARSAWYRTVGQAIRDGLWTVEVVIKGNVVLRVGPKEQRTGRTGRRIEWRKG
jgi:hypothetical protein